MTAYAPPVSLEGPDLDLYRSLYNTWSKKRARNMLRTVYYEGKNALKDFGISVPPQMQPVYTPLQWISKGVHALADRSQFEGFVSASGSADPFELGAILGDNNFEEEFPQAVVSSAIHACSFLTVTEGDVQSGEPEILILARSADSSGAKWDRRRRALSGFLSIVDVDDTRQPTQMVMYTPERVYTMTRRDNSGVWDTTWVRNKLGEVSVARLAYHPELNRPFGHSRISRTAMGLTDAAVRTLLRAEVSAEFYSADKYWLFGADVTKFIGDDKWTALMGRMNAIDTEPGDETPKIERFSGASPQPHTEQMRLIQGMFADDQDLDVKFADASNPSSADAIYAAKEDLIIDVRTSNKVWGRGAVKAAQMAVRLRDGVEATPELRSLSARFTDPAIVSPSGRADAFSKLASAIEGFGTSEVGMEFAGLSRDQIVRFQAEKRRADAGSRIAQLVEAAKGLRADGDTATDRGVQDSEPDPGEVGAA